MRPAATANISNTAAAGRSSRPKMRWSPSQCCAFSEFASKMSASIPATANLMAEQRMTDRCRRRIRRWPFAHPIALALPWIGRQLDRLAEARLNALPGEIASGGIGASAGLQQSVPFRPAAAQAIPARPASAPRTPRHSAIAAGQHRLRPDLDENVVAIFSHRANGSGEAHRLAHVAAEIGGVEAHVVGAARRSRSNTRQSTVISGAHIAEPIDELALERRHLRAVERVLHRQHAVAHAARRQRRKRLLERGGFARQHDAARAVDRAEQSWSPYGARVPAASASVSPTEAMRPSPVACCMMRPRCQTTRTASRSSSTPATCSAAISPTLWPTTPSATRPTTSKRRERDLQGEQRRLRDLGLVEPRALLRPAELLQQRPAR